jgi:hypothetical protein
MESEQGQDEQAEGPSVIQERLNWKLACRDDAKVAQELYAGEEIEEMHELPRVLFSDLGLMELVGFNAQQCENGLTKRGDAQRQTKKKQGPISAQCLAQNISKLKMEVNCLPRRAMRGAGSSSKPAG